MTTQETADYEHRTRMLMAAPDLLEACEAALTYLTTKGDKGPVQMLRDAIEKARRFQRAR